MSVIFFFFNVLKKFIEHKKVVYDIHYDDNSLVIYTFISLKVSHLFTLKPYTIQPVTCTIEQERRCLITIH